MLDSSFSFAEPLLVDTASRNAYCSMRVYAFALLVGSVLALIPCWLSCTYFGGRQHQTLQSLTFIASHIQLRHATSKPLRQLSRVSRRFRSRPSASEDSTSGPSSDDWRKFRQQLISGGLKLTTDNTSAGVVADGGFLGAAAKRQVVAPGNEALLRNQSQALYDEYISGTWAHESPIEVGGLMLRMPLEAQLTEFLRSGSREFPRLSDDLRNKLCKELPGSETGESLDEQIKIWSQNCAYCFRFCERYTKNYFEQIASNVQAKKKFTVDSKSPLGGLIQLYSRTNQDWQQVVLVLKSSEAGAEGVAINRPFRRQLDRDMAKLLLKKSGEPDELADVMIGAFRGNACMYIGGESNLEEGAILVHGFSSLAGSVEIAPGTGIYTGGERAAIEAVRDGIYSPFDFRWFVGYQTGLKTLDGAWRSAACARPVALKQCLGLPKPLWHEVMELMGGECETLSRFEILKRDDLLDATMEPNATTGNISSTTRGLEN